VKTQGCPPLANEFSLLRRVDRQSSRSVSVISSVCYVYSPKKAAYQKIKNAHELNIRHRGEDYTGVKSWCWFLWPRRCYCLP